MANDFSTVKNNQTSEKFYLARIVPRRTVNDDLVSIGGGQYQMTFPYFPQKALANETELTKVDVISGAGEWSYDEDTQLLTVYSTPSSSNFINIYYYLFYTGGRHKTITEDPEDTATAIRDWLPRIKSNPVIDSSVEDVIEGNLKVSLSRLIVINDQFEFQAYLTDNDSFNKAEIKVWLALDDIENIQKIYDGRVRRINLGETTVNIEFDDPLTGILEPSLMGDDSSETYFTEDDFPNMAPNSTGLPIRYIFGTASRYQTKTDTAITGLTDAQKIEEQSLELCVCTEFSNSVATTTNREWGVCRVSSDGFLAFGFTPSNVDNSAGGYTRLDGTAAEVDKFRVGDTMLITQAGSHYERVVLVDRTNNYVYITKNGALSTSAVVGSNDCPTIVVTDELGNDFYLLYSRDYTTGVVTTSGGNKFLTITLVDNFETNHAGLTTLDPGIHRVKYKVRPDTTSGQHGLVIKALLENAGLTVNSASVTAANSSLPVNCAFSIPQFDEDDIKRYVDYVQIILKSALSYISLNNSFEIEYHLFDTPLSTAEITNVDILKDSMDIEIKYNDIVHQIISFNPHWSSAEAKEDPADTPSVTEINLKAKYLHNINKVTRFRHVLESMNTRLAKIIDVRSERRVIYNFDTKIINIDNIIGDDIKLVRDGILGNDASKVVKILGLRKSPKKTNLIASDLLNI